MISITGQFFPPNQSLRFDAVLTQENDHYRLIVKDTEGREGSLTDLEFSPRIGNIERRISWQDGGLFTSSDNAAIDQLASRNSRSTNRLHRLESSWRMVIIALLLLPVLGYSTFRWGIPSAANHVAMQLPTSTMELVSTGAMKSLDKLYFSPSNLTLDKQEDVHQRFNSLINALPDSQYNYRLYFRRMYGIPNAMALPSGEIVVTDAFVKMAEPGELEAVLLHEIAHVEERHGMQQVLSAGAVSGIVTVALGDLSALGDIAVSVPVFLTQASYSREKETAADAYAFKHMSKAGIDPKHFASIIQKIGGSLETDKEKRSYLSSHPMTQERARKALEASEAFNAGW